MKPSGTTTHRLTRLLEGSSCLRQCVLIQVASVYVESPHVCKCLYCLCVGARLAACLDACSLQQTLPLVLMITIHFSQLLALCSVLCKFQLIDLLYY